MRFSTVLRLAFIGLGLSVLLSGCGPGLIILGGGGTGGWLGFAGSGDDDKDKTPAAPIVPGPVNTAPVAFVQALEREESPATLDFRLVDAESDLLDIVVEYALVADPQDADFSACTGAIGSSITALASSAGGVNHTFDWDYGTDLGGLAATEGITIRVRPHDGTVDGSHGVLGDLAVGNDAPVVMAAQAVGTTLSGNVLITFDLADTSSDPAGFDVRIISSQFAEPFDLSGSDFLGTNPIGLPGPLSTNPTGMAGQVVWDSEALFPFHDGTVQIIITPKDQPAGFSQVGQGNGLTIGPYTLNNLGNRAPTMFLAVPPDGLSFYGKVNLRAFVQDPDSSSVYITCEYQTSNGGPYSPCTMTGGTGTVGPFATLSNQPLGYDLIWNALLDLQPQGLVSFDQCRLRLTVYDADVGDVINTGEFEMVLGEAPTIVSASVQGDDGQIPIIVNIRDLAADPCSLRVGYRLDGVSAFTALTQADFTYGDLSSVVASTSGAGASNVLILNTLSSNLAPFFGNQNQLTVQLEIIATDHPPGDDTGDPLVLELDSAPFILGPFVVLNDPNGTEVYEISVTVTGGTGSGDKYTALPNEERYFQASVFPAQLSPDDEAWWWTWPDSGTLPGLTIVPDETTVPGQGATATLTLPADMLGWTYIVVYAQSTQSFVMADPYYILIGDPVQDVTAFPSTLVTLISGQGTQLSAIVDPVTAPQYVQWSIPPGMGAIYNDGWYQSDGGLSSAIQFDATATTIDPGISDTVTIRVVPEPTGVIVSGPTPVQVGGANVSYSAVVSPASAPQDVFWEIRWNDFYYGSGNDFCGRVSATGVYTPPAVLPQPDRIYIIARSQYFSWVYFEFLVQLTGNNPTNFQVIMDPQPPPQPTHLFASGQGRRFLAINFTPPDAPYVTWSVDQPTLGSIDSYTGYFTPAPEIGATAQIVTIRGRATYGGVERTLNVTIQPKQPLTVPSSVNIFPAAGLISDSAQYPSNNVDFLSLVNPPAAPQAVNWSIQTGMLGAPNSGAVDGEGRYYPPYNYGSYTKDGQVTLRAQCAGHPPFGNATVYVSGQGEWGNHDMPPMGRNDPGAVWEPASQTCWFFGGRSETRRFTEQETHVWIFNGQPAANIRWFPGPDIDVGLDYPKPAKNAIAVQRTPSFVGTVSPHMIALVGDNSNTVRMAYFNLGVSSNWTAYYPGYDVEPQDVPRMTSVGRYHLLLFEDASIQQLWLLDGTTIYRFSYITGNWAARITGVTNQPTSPNTCAYFMDGVGNHCLVGPLSGSTLETTVISLQTTPSVQWNIISDTGSGSGGPRNPALQDCSAVYIASSNKVLVFGGRSTTGPNPNDNVWEITLPAGTWTAMPLILAKPFARTDAAFVRVTDNGTTRYLLYGGRVGVFGTGIAGDLWEYSNFTSSFIPFNPPGIMPQARKYAASAWAANANAGFIYGGVCQYGNSNELWRFTYSTTGGFTWTRFAQNVVPALRAASMVYDSDNSRILLLWGSTNASGSSGVSNAVYALNTVAGSWTTVNPTLGTGVPAPPPGRLGAAATYDADNDRVVSFGGLRQDAGAAVLLSDLVYLKVTPLNTPQWVAVGATTGSSPPPLMGAFLGYDPTCYQNGKTRYVILGGNRNPNGETVSYEVFTFDLAANAWASIILSAPYFARPPYDCAAAFDSSQWRRFIYAPKGNYSNAVGALLGNTPEWQEFQYSGLHYFQPRGASGVYDPVNKRFFALLGEIDVPGVGAAMFGAYRLLKWS